MRPRPNSTAESLLSTNIFDGAGRLTKAVIPRHELTYEFDQTSTCGVNTAAGRNGNRTGFTDVKDGTVVTDVTYCYDNADRLTATISSATGASPVIDFDLTTVGTTASATLAYDLHGNTTKLADQTLRYDVADRHMGTTLKDGTVITYVRDVTGRIVARCLARPLVDFVDWRTGLALREAGQTPFRSRAELKRARHDAAEADLTR